VETGGKLHESELREFWDGDGPCNTVEILAAAIRAGLELCSSCLACRPPVKRRWNCAKTCSRPAGCD